MNTIASKTFPRSPQTELRDTGTVATKEQALASSAIDTRVRSGCGPLSGRQIAVGDGQATQALRRANAATQASVSPDLKVKMEDASPGIAHLKERKLSHGDGQSAARSAAASAAILRLLSGISNLLKTVLQAPLALFRSASPQHQSPQPSADQLKSFEANACKIGDEFKAIPVPTANTPEGDVLCKQAVSDIKRVGITVNGKLYPPDGTNEDMQALSRDLSAACGKTMAHWVSCYANQQILGPIAELLAQLPLGPNGEAGFQPMGTSRQAYSITVLPDKSLQLDVKCDWNSIPVLALRAPEEMGEGMVEMNPSSSITTQFSIHLKMDPSAPADTPPIASMLKQPECNINLKYLADQ